MKLCKAQRDQLPSDEGLGSLGEEPKEKYSHPTRPPDGLTVEELIEELQSMPKEAIVCFGYNYGDYWHSQVAKGVKSVEGQQVVWSDYHTMHKEANPEYNEDDEQYDVVLLK